MRLLALLTASLLATTLFAADKPNIIIYMVDDLGWNHISAATTMGTHPKKYQTPHLAKLAEQGLSFTHAYAQPNCAPTRAAMLSGQYPARIHNDVYVVGSLNRHGRGGITKEAAQFNGPPQTEDVAAEAITIAEAMKKNGYATAHIGKYHVGGHGTDTTLPENVGFDINIGGFSQGHQPVCFASQGDKGGKKKKGKGKKKGKKAPKEVEEETAAAKPVITADTPWKFRSLGRGHFDQYAAPYTADYVKKHQLPESLIGTPKHVGDAIGDALEETVATLHEGGKPFYLQFYTYAVHGPVKSRPDLKVRAAKFAGDKAANYVGFILSIDENLKRMHQILADPNGDGDTSDSIAKNTLILFTSDNGGTHAGNEPLKGKKGMLTEGGMRVPLIAYWPGVVPAGKVTHRKMHAVDYYPTCLELAGGAWSPPAGEHPLDGESFADVLKNPDQAKTRGPIHFFFPGYLDVRAQPSAVIIDEVGDQRYKLYYFYETNSWELYNLSKDQGEAENLIKTHAEIASGLSKKLNSWFMQEHPTWQPKYPIRKSDKKSAGPPPVF